MSIQQFCLRWNNHQPNFISVFTTLLNTKSLVDVTLAAEGRHLQAHKVVLSACSVYFQTLFTENPSRHPIVILKDVKYSDLRIMVDFMYYGEVNVSQEQLPQVLETAKMLKIKGLTEMPESTSLTRSQGTMAEFLAPGDETHRQSASPCNSPNPKRKRNRRPSTGNQQGMSEENQQETGPPSVDLGRNDSITLSSLPQHQRRLIKEYDEDATVDAGQQTEETQNNMHSNDPLLMETNPPGLTQDGGGPSISQRRRLFQRQGRLRRNSDEAPPLKKHASLPLPGTSSHSLTSGPSHSHATLQKHSSHPPMAQSRSRRPKQEESALQIRAVTLIDRQSLSDAGTSFESGEGAPPRASHTPAMRSGPPLSCNFCWNTVDECGRILRRKTQYHCPECRTNLCIVPCFHEYHDGTAEAEAAASARLCEELRRVRHPHED